MPPFSAQHLEENKDYYEYLGSDIWLVDDHRWAYYIWEEQRAFKELDKFCLVHVDYHWDSVCDFHESKQKENELRCADLETIHDFVEEGVWIKFDSFICPAIIRGFINNIHFYCTQDNGDDIGIDTEILAREGTEQFIHNSLEELSSIKTTFPLIFDFCLDIFNNSEMWYEGDIWNEQEILNLLEACKPLVINADIVTVSLSFGYSGTIEDTRRLAEIVIPLFLAWKDES